MDINTYGAFRVIVIVFLYLSHARSFLWILTNTASREKHSTEKKSLRNNVPIQQEHCSDLFKRLFVAADGGAGVVVDGVAGVDVVVVVVYDGAVVVAAVAGVSIERIIRINLATPPNQS